MSEIKLYETFEFTDARDRVVDAAARKAIVELGEMLELLQERVRELEEFCRLAPE
jgi:hypothetical protein